MAQTPTTTNVDEEQSDSDMDLFSLPKKRAKSRLKGKAAKKNKNKNKNKNKTKGKSKSKSKSNARSKSKSTSESNSNSNSESSCNSPSFDDSNCNINNNNISPVEKAPNLNIDINRKVSTCQRIHMRLGNVVMAIIISIPMEELSKFSQNNNSLYCNLLAYIRDKLGAVLQAQLTKLQAPKGKIRSKNLATFSILKNDKIICACQMQKQSPNYFLLENIGLKNVSSSEYLKHNLSPWVLQVYAVSKNGHLPFNDEGEVIVSQYLKPRKPKPPSNENN